MEEQSIPPLKASGIDSNLLHVTAIFCHGAWVSHKAETCWEGQEKQKWDCEHTTLTSPPSQPEILLLEKEGIGNDRLGGKSMMSLVEKKYNALYDPSQLRNMLNETCHFGQLILRGYAQEHTPERKAMVWQLVCTPITPTVIMML